jgi:hypothetical protein
VAALVELAGFDVDGQLDGAPRGRGELVMQAVELGRDQGEKVAGLGEGVFPLGPVSAAFLVAAADWVAVGQQQGKGALVGMESHGVARHHVGTVREPGDAAEALRLALGEIAVGRAVEAGQAGIAIRVDAHDGVQFELVRHVGNGQAAVVDDVALGRERNPVHFDRQGLQFLSVQQQGRLRLARSRVAAYRQARADPGFAREEGDIEVDPVYQERRRRVVLEMNGLGSLAFHGGSVLS